MKKIIFKLLFAVLIFQSCTFETGTVGSWQNDKIDVNIKLKIASLNDKLFKALMANNIAGVKALMSPGLVNNLGNKVDTIVNTVSSNYHATEYTTLDEFYTKNAYAGLPDTLLSSRGNDNDYKIEYVALNRDAYASLIVSKNQAVNCLIFAVYGKHDDDWKLNILQIGSYSMLGKTASDYYKEASQQYAKGNLIEASDLIVIASELLDPANKHLQYNNENEIKDFCTKVLREANTTYSFPMTIKQAEKQPQIFSINPQAIDEDGYKGVYPVITYLTTINLKDTVALKSQNKSLQKVIGQVFKGLDQKKLILYRALDIFPDGKHKVNYYKFIQKS